MSPTPLWSTQSASACHSNAPIARRTPLTRTFEVFGSDLLEKFAELLDLGFLLVRNGHAGFAEHLLGADDPDVHPKRQRDRVRGPGADLDAAGEGQLAKEHTLAQVGDAHLGELLPSGQQHVAEKVMRHRPRRDDPLLSMGDRARFVGPYPDGQEPISADLSEQDDRIVGRHLYPDTHHVELTHVLNTTPETGSNGGRWCS